MTDLTEPTEPIETTGVTGVTRRGLLASAGAGLAVPALPGTPPGLTSGRGAPQPPPVTVGPDDPRYRELTTRGYNGRFTARPETVRLVHSTEQVVRAVQDAVRAGQRPAVRSGGHCFENFVDDPGVDVLIDMSQMRAVYFDPARRAFAVEAGATLGEVYRTLYLNWRVTLPGGSCPSVGAGGHILGGGYGPLSRSHGLTVDHLYAVEVVVVDRAGRARSVVATREARDPNRDLWWAHTGGGGGNFGVVTRYWLRSPGAAGSDPSRLLPRPPATLLTAALTWDWNVLTEPVFRRLVRNFGAWHAGPGIAGLDSGLSLSHRVTGQVRLEAKLDGTLPDAGALMDRYLAAVTEGLGAPATPERSTSPWLRQTLSLELGPGGYRFKSKAGFLRRPWTDEQIAIVHRRLTEGGEEHYGSAVYLNSFGGRINAVPSSATAMAHRDAVLSAFYETVWWEDGQDEAQLGWVRRLYRDVHADAGGVPVPGDVYGGAFVNYPDTDLADPEQNTSGVPWHTLYYRGNYPGLQRVKARWDPRDVFRHALAIRPPA